MSSSAHRVVIVGGGFGGLFATKSLRDEPVAVTLVDRTNHHLFQPLLYQVATGILSEGAIAPPLREVLRRQRNVIVELAEVQAFDLERQTVTALRAVGEPITLAYDSLIVAAGAGESYFGHDEFARYAPGMKTVDDALELRTRIFGAFELAELEPDPAERRAWLTFAVIGAGPTGVEMAGQIAELARRSLKRNFRRFDPADARVLLFDAGERPLPTFGDHLSGRGARELERVGVELRMRCNVIDVDSGGIVVDGPEGEVRIPCRAKVWSAGVQASPLATLLAAQSGAAIDRAGRIEVLPDCTLPGHPEVFVVGDMMALEDLPGVAEVAMQSGSHAARTISRRLRGEAEGEPFVYHDRGSMATVSRFHAVVSIGGVKFSGLFAWLLWALVHLTFLVGFKNRWIALSKWWFAFIGSARDERTISMERTAARTIAVPGAREVPADLAQPASGRAPLE